HSPAVIGSTVSGARDSGIDRQWEGRPSGINAGGGAGQLTSVRLWRSSCTRRADIHEEASVKPRARRNRDFPDIHSASSAFAERHEKVCGCSHSHQRRRTAPCRTPGCNLSPALDLDVEPPGTWIASPPDQHLVVVAGPSPG